MRLHLSYLIYVLRHKWFVIVSCPQWGVPLWRGIIHDWTKFTRREWSAYAHNFFNADGSRRSVRDKTGAYDANAQNIAFRLAWLSHQRNKHHWQAWISIADGGNFAALPMPEKYAREMLADWTGAGRAISGEPNPRSWYLANRSKMVLHAQTRDFCEDMMGIETSSRLPPGPGRNPVWRTADAAICPVWEATPMPLVAEARQKTMRLDADDEGAKAFEALNGPALIEAVERLGEEAEQ